MANNSDEKIEREQLEADVVIVGAGPAGLACALRLAELIANHNRESGSSSLSAENIYVIEKADELGMHSLSGAVMDPRGLRELVPDCEKQGAPLDTPVTDDAAYFLTAKRALRFPITPPPLRNHGNYVVSLARLVQWLGQRAEQAGINIFTGFAGSALLLEDRRVVGIQTDDKGIDKNGNRKSNFQAGYELRARVTVLAEGPRGSLTRQLIDRFKLDEGRNPQVYALGVKEIWEVPEGRIRPGTVWHTMGYPLGSDMYGGGWVYGLQDSRISVGLVSGLQYANPLFDPHTAFQQFKLHPFVRRLLEGGKLLRYGAKTIPEGGYWAIPQTFVDGALIVGDSGGFLDSQRLKGIHMALKTGMLAAETIFEALRSGDTSTRVLKTFGERVEASWVKKQLWRVRNFHQGFEHGLWRGLLHAGLQFVTGGRGLRNRYRNRAGHEHYKRLSELPPAKPTPIQPDGALTFDKVTDVYHSGTRHEEDQPVHLLVQDTDICSNRCVAEYGNPCQYFCPAAVYEMVESEGRKQLRLNPSNCVHCKACDIMDPYEIITWVPPEGGGGPHYEGM
ncbi:MAG: electron transfer flavoprotein-ubiquinone oxidoreductase [Acidobacteria bacterium]|nr:electron transfer flavoprotein-ubiquinone oxidoreductase [Acidobacteriota bacterium]